MVSPAARARVGPHRNGRLAKELTITSIGQYYYQAGSPDQKAEQKGRDNDQQESFNRKGTDRSPRPDKRADQGNESDENQYRTEHYGEVGRAHLDGSPDFVITRGQAIKMAPDPIAI